MDRLNSVELCDLGEIKVMAIKGKNIIDVGQECIELANLLQVAVRLYFNNKQILIFTNSTVKDIITLSLK